MANYNSKDTSKYSRYEKQSISNKKRPNNMESNIELLDDLDSTKNLDISFMDGIKRKKVIEQKTDVLDINQINRANADYNNAIDLRSRLKLCSYLLLFFGIFTSILLIFIVYHYITFDHSEESIVHIDYVEDKEEPKAKIVDENCLFLSDNTLIGLNKRYSSKHVFSTGEYTTGTVEANLKKFVYQYNPSKVVILLGINDLKDGIGNDEIVANLENIIKNIKKNRPYAQLYLQSIYPVNDSYNLYEDDINSRIFDLNKDLEIISKKLDVKYIDLYDNLVDDDGNLDSRYGKNGKITEEGYDIVVDILNKFI